MSRTASPGTCSGDFLRKEAQTPLHELFLVGGRGCEISTNSESILAAARESFVRNEGPGIPTELRIRLWVDASAAGQAPRPKPYVRGLDHLVFAGFEADSSALIDLRTRRVIGRFSPQISGDRAYWREVILPMIVSIVSGSLGIAEIHCACVARNQGGLLLAGPSGSGKSTLSLALGQVGFGFLSDDRTFCSLRQGKLVAWGLPLLLKLRSDAATWFQELRQQSPTDMWKGESVFRYEADLQFGVQRVRECEPRLVVFLDQRKARGFCLNHVPRSEAARRLEADMMAELPEAAAEQARTIDELAGLPCWRLEYGGAPQIIAEQLSHYFDRLECPS